jgi:tetratricopeptide (TPR) repeat protein
MNLHVCEIDLQTMRPISPYWYSALKAMSKDSKIIKFPRIFPTRSISPNEHQDDFDDFEDWELYAQLIEKQDYPGLVRYCKKRAEQRPDDLYAQCNLGHAYVLSGEYENAIDFMSDHHRKHPWIGDYQYVILDALFALGKDEGDFNWVEKPVVLRLSENILDACHEFLKPKRKPRAVADLYIEFVMKGYLLFTEEDLYNALATDQRFIVENPYEDQHLAKVSVVRKKGKNRKT